MVVKSGARQRCRRAGRTNPDNFNPASRFMSNAGQQTWIERTAALGHGGTLVAIHCESRVTSRSNVFAIFLNSGLVHRVGPNRLYVRLAREMAGLGISSLRFDLSGIGDSANASTDANSILEQVQQDIRAAIDFAFAQGAQGVLLLGLCSGADNAFVTAVRDARVSGLVLIDPNAYRTFTFYLHHIRKRILRGRTWLNLISGPHSIPNRLARLRTKPDAAPEGAASVFLAPTTLPAIEETRSQLSELIRRQTKMLYIFSGGLEWRYNHRRQLFRAFPGLDWSQCVELEYYGDADHTFSRVDHQHRLIDRVCGWLRSTDFRTATAQVEREEILV